MKKKGRRGVGKSRLVAPRLFFFCFVFFLCLVSARRRNMTTVADLFKRANYTTAQVGKWHGGMSVEAQLPVHRGFDSSFGYLAGENDHYTVPKMLKKRKKRK